MTQADQMTQARGREAANRGRRDTPHPPSTLQAQSGASLRQWTVVKEQISHPGNGTTNQKQEKLCLLSGLPTQKTPLHPKGINTLSEQKKEQV
ncbi:hypothetical protein INR49_027512 [Caranx melampygus]|nr:hypothetical protein INR49_027512 [Caranx melampygus]